jgi:hypothetical protein
VKRDSLAPLKRDSLAPLKRDSLAPLWERDDFLPLADY